MKKVILNLFATATASAICLAPLSARAAAGDLLVTGVDFSQFNDSIFRFTPAGMKSTFATGDISSVLEGLAFDRSANLYVADTGAGTISKFTPAGDETTFASGLEGPFGLAFDGAGNLFAAEISSGKILKFTPDGTQSTFASGLGQPVDLAFDSAGNLFVSDSTNNTIVKLAPDGTDTTFASGLNAPAGLAFDGTGNLFEADNGSGTIFKFTPDGTKSTFASGLGNVQGGLAFDSSGNLFAASGDSILKFAPDGTSTTFASLVGHFLVFEPVTETLRNISARGLVGTGDDVLIGGFIVGGSALANNAVVVRAIGPSLAQAGVANPLADPVLELHNASGATVASNDDWQDTQEEQITASGLAPTDPSESAIFATLPAGGYTAIVRGAGDTTGVALVEVYSVAP